MTGPKYPRLLTLAAVVVVVAALYFAKVILVPFATAFLLAFLLSPLVNRLRKVGLPRVVAVITVMVLAVAGVGGLGWVVAGQLNDFVNKLPEYHENLQGKFASARSGLMGQIERAAKTVNEITQPASKPTDVVVQPTAATTSHEASPLDVMEPLAQIASMLGAIGVVFLFVVLMLLQKDDMRDRLIRLAGSQLYVTTRAFDEAGAKVSRYLLLTSCMNGLYGLCIGVTLSLVGLPNSLLWGVLAALLRFIPYVGTWIAAACPIIAGARHLSWLDHSTRCLRCHPRSRSDQCLRRRALGVRGGDGGLVRCIARRHGLLDLALGPAWAVSRDASHGLPRGHGEVRPSAQFPGCPSR